MSNYKKPISILEQLTQHHHHKSVTRQHKIFPKLSHPNPHTVSLINPKQPNQRYLSPSVAQVQGDSHWSVSQPHKNSMNSTNYKFGDSFLKNKENLSSNPNVKLITRKNKRPYNEDRFLIKPACKLSPFLLQRHKPDKLSKIYDIFAVFDGHGGSKCVDFLKDNFEFMLVRSGLTKTNPT